MFKRFLIMNKLYLLPKCFPDTLFCMRPSKENMNLYMYICMSYTKKCSFQAIILVSFGRRGLHSSYCVQQDSSAY